MLKPEQVPDEVVEAFQRAWADMSTLSTKECLAAALNAWPGNDIVGYGPPFYGIDLILPLPTEASDD